MRHICRTYLQIAAAVLIGKPSQHWKNLPIYRIYPQIAVVPIREDANLLHQNLTTCRTYP